MQQPSNRTRIEPLPIIGSLVIIAFGLYVLIDHPQLNPPAYPTMTILAIIALIAGLAVLGGTLYTSIKRARKKQGENKT